MSQIKATNTPFGVTLNLDIGTGVAWDNCDWYVETQNGKDTLHDTAGTLYMTLANTILAKNTSET